MGLSEEQIRDAEIVEVEYSDGTVKVLKGLDYYARVVATRVPEAVRRLHIPITDPEQEAVLEIVIERQASDDDAAGLALPRPVH